MNWKKAFFILILFFTRSGFSDIDQVGKFNIGAAAGYTTGLGLSYRQWIGSMGYQITLAPFFSENDDNSTAFFSFGTTVLRKFNEARFVNLFAYCGAHLFYYSDIYKKRPTFPDDGYTYYTEDSRTRKIILGAGPGLDFHFLRISFNLMCGIAGNYETYTGNYGYSMTGETALYYSF